MKTIRINILELLIFLLCILPILGCGKQKDEKATTNEVVQLVVDMTTTEPSYKDIFIGCELIKLDSDPQALLARIYKTECAGDSIIILDKSKGNLMLFSSSGKFLNKIGSKGDGPDEYYFCYDFAIHPGSGNLTLLNPIGEMIEYNMNGGYISRQALKGKPNYYACQWIDNDKMARWSCVDYNEGALVVADITDNKILYEDWHDDSDINFQRTNPFYKYGEITYFTPPFSGEVYHVGDSCLNLAYIWKFNPESIKKDYLDEIRAIEESNKANDKLNSDFKNCLIKDFPIFNAETGKYYYIALETGVGEESVIKSVFYSKDNDEYVVFTRFKEGMSFRPLYIDSRYALCQIPYNEIPIFNDLLGLDIQCTEDENPVLAKFFFKK